MSDIFQIASIGMQEGKQRLEAISQNAASASLPGYRRQVVTGRSFAAALSAPNAITASTADTARTSSPLPNNPALRQSNSVDLHPGSTVATGRALDLSIDADDLFFALTDDTQTWLTRAGAFHLNEDSVLVGERGLRVVGVQGDVHLPGSDVEVAADGSITHQGDIVAALQLFRPTDQTSLRAAKGSLLETPGGLQPAETGTQRVRSGTLEASNTDAAREMLSLIALSRQFEGLSHVVQGYNEMLGHAIEKLGEI